jgi:malate permease and related proteins
MGIFEQLFIKLLPLYFIIFLGYIAGKRLKVARESIASFLIYIVVPVVYFKAIFEMKLTIVSFSYPIYLFLVGICLSTSFFYFGEKLFKNKEIAALLSLTSTLANTGYFGLPLLFVLYGESILGTTVLVSFGLVLHEATLGFYLAAQGKYSPKQALTKTLKVPIIYSVILAFLCNYLYNHYFVNLPETVLKDTLELFIKNSLSMMNYFIGTLTVLGMSMIGLGLAKINHLKFNWRFISLSLFSKYIVYPSIFLIFYIINSKIHVFDNEVLKVIFYLSLVPIGANSITLATQLNLDTDDASIVVIISTLISLLIIPFLASAQLSFL